MKYFADKCLMQLMRKMAETKTAGADAMQTKRGYSSWQSHFCGREGGKCTGKPSLYSSSLSISQFQLRPAPPRATAGHLSALSVPGVGHLEFCAARGPRICQPRGHSWAFDTQAVSYQNITTQRILLGKKQIGSSVKDRKNWGGL